MTERRRYPRKPVRLNCKLRLTTGVEILGYTRNISREGLFLVTHDEEQPERQQAPKCYDVGELIMEYTVGGAASSLSVRCRIVYITNKGVGILTFYSELSKDEQNVVNSILERGIGNL